MPYDKTHEYSFNSSSLHRLNALVEQALTAGYVAPLKLRCDRPGCLINNNRNYMRRNLNKFVKKLTQYFDNSITCKVHLQAAPSSPLAPVSPLVPLSP